MSYHHLTLEERKKLARMWKTKASIREIGRALGRSASTISREIKRNISRGNRQVLYRPVNAQKKYQARKCVERTGKYADTLLVSYVQEKLLETWSPEQVAGRMPLDYPDAPSMRVSHSTIYHWLHQGRLGQATLCLRHAGHRHGEHRGRFLGIRTLRQRGKEIWRRERIGDREMDTIVSSDRASHAGLLTMCDRKSRYCIAVLLERCHSNKHVFQALAKIVASYPCRSFSTDQAQNLAVIRVLRASWGCPSTFAHREARGKRVRWKT